MVQVEGLTKLYGEFVAVNELSFAVQPGEVMGLVGPNGAGKTTTLRCLAGIIPPTRGTVRVGGHDLVRDPIAAKKQLAFFTDEPRLFDYLTVWQHLNFVARIYQVADYERTGRELLEELEIANKTDALPGELSRGMKQKLAIACGLLHSPRVIYFDEPLTGLDPIGIRRMKDSILKRARDGAAIIISSHLLHLVEEICSRILILKNGRKIIDGTLEEITRKFSEQPGDANLEEIFFRATSEHRHEPAPASRRCCHAETNDDRRAALSAIPLVPQPAGQPVQAAQAAEIPHRRHCGRTLFLLVISSATFFAGSAVGRRGIMTVSPEHRLLFELLGALALFVIVLLAWIIPHERAALTFTEAEVAFLFPAPITRRTLIHFKLLRSQLGIFFTTSYSRCFPGDSAAMSGFTHSAGGWFSRC